jgi:hypothetical protein
VDMRREKLHCMVMVPIFEKDEKWENLFSTTSRVQKWEFFVLDLPLRDTVLRKMTDEIIFISWLDLLKPNLTRGTVH